MKLGIVTAMHDRHDMTLVFLQSMVDIRDTFGVSLHVAVTTGDAIIPHLIENNIDFIEHENKPLGRKWNSIFLHLKDSDLTHYMILGSDDIPSHGFIRHALTLGEYDMSGINGLWFWGLNPRRAGFLVFGFFPTKVLSGAGKIISRRVVELCDHKPWGDGVGFGMDANMMGVIRAASSEKDVPLSYHTYSLMETGGFLVDVKYQEHISSMSPITRRENFEVQEADDVLLTHLPEKIYNSLYVLYAKMVDSQMIARKLKKPNTNG